jgi:chemotaxis signal transduction protein
LAREASLQLRQDKTPIANQSSYIGYIRQLEIPVYDLSLLLGETTTATVQGNEQVILMKDAGSYEQAYGFRVTNTTEVITVNLAELAPLPEIVEYNKTQPLVWALWLKFTNDNKLELINLIDPIAIVKNTHFE